MLPVQLGSGVNLLGYYMFHGGRNPVGRSTLEESTATGGHNDTNAINYDFQAPLGPDGQQRPVLARLRPYHLFLHDFGDRLAPMTVRKPALTPASPADLATPRLSVRSDGERGFLFVNNHVRQYPMPALRDVRFAVALPGQAIEFPRQPVTIADGSYFVWPINFDLDGTTLNYATAQPVARLDAGADGVLYVFSATEGIPVELAFDAAAAPFVKAAGARAVRDGGRLVFDRVEPGTGAVLRIERPGARAVSVMLLTQQQVRELSIGELGGMRRMVLSAQQAYFENGALQLRSAGDSHFRAAVYPPLATGALRPAARDGLFQVFEAQQAPRQLEARLTPLRAAGKAPAIASGGHSKGALQPKPESWRTAAAWSVQLPAGQLEGLDDALVRIDFVGDAGRLLAGTRMLDDWYYSGYGWEIGMKQLGDFAKEPLTVSVLPLRADAPIYLPKEARPDFGGQAQVAQLRKVSVTPVYKWTIAP
jgi:beta-galactosidase